MKTLYPDALLADIIGAGPGSRVDIVSRLMYYIKHNKLQDRLDKRWVDSDAKLSKIFGARFNIFLIAGMIAKHVSSKAYGTSVHVNEVEEETTQEAWLAESDCGLPRVAGEALAQSQADS